MECNIGELNSTTDIKAEILALIKANPAIRTSTIILSLDYDIENIVKALDELTAEGKVEPKPCSSFDSKNIASNVDENSRGEKQA
jgi:hypothetical protein